MSIVDVYPLSPLQNGILYHSLREEAASVYLLQFSYNLEGYLEPALVEEAFNELFRRHDILRTAFNYDDLKKPVQLVLRERQIEFNQEDLRSLSHEEQLDHIRHFRQLDQARGFDLRKDVLMRVALLRLQDQQYEMIWSFHHILMDGWCMSILIHELLAIYHSLLGKSRHNLPPVTPYRRYIQWLEEQNSQRALEYWNQYLEGFETATPLKKQGKQPGFLQQEEIVILDRQLTDRLVQYTGKLGVTLNALIQTAWGVLLGRYNNTGDVVFGTIVSGRPPGIAGIETMIGLFINAIPVRVKFDSNDTFAAIAAQVHGDGVAGINYHFSQLADIQSLTPMGNQLIDHLLVFENYPIEEQIEGIVLQQQATDAHSFQVENINIYEHSNYDLSLVIVPGKALMFKFRYNSFAYPAPYIKKLAAHFTTILEQISHEPDVHTGQLEILTDKEKAELLQIGKGTLSTVPEPATFVTMFESMVTKVPAQPAVRWDKGVLTYSELNEKANIAAHTLQHKYGLKKGDLVALIIERSEWSVISILAILKAGGVYVPIDAGYPAQRIRDILAHTDVQLLITDSSGLFTVMEYYHRSLVAIDIELNEWEAKTDNLPVVSAPQDLSYIIYTSGSTGKPNGVMITHEGQVNMFRSQMELFSPGPDDHILQFASLSFDASVWEITMALLSGATLELITKDKINNAVEFIRYINQQQVTIATLPPVYVKSIAIHEATTLRILITAGEEAYPEDVMKYAVQFRYFNAYGPSEYSVCISAYELAAGKKVSHIVPIGNALLNTSIYILDNHLRLVPEGMPGEICVSGKGISKGYLYNQELTDVRFVPSPFEDGEKLYRTGDYGRWNEDHQLEFLGRKDAQVKIRGHRVEVGEVVNKLKALDMLQDAVVITDKDHTTGTTVLKAYYVAPEPVSEFLIREELAAVLPDYMIPSFFTWIEKIPLNNNGKLDKKLLPETGQPTGQQETITDQDEKELAAIWSEILGVPVVSSQQHFFHMGGHSLKVIQLISRVQKQFSIYMDLKDVFEHPVLKQQIAFIRKMQQGGFENINVLPEQPYYPISHAQKRLWILQQLEKDSTAYNIPHAYRIASAVNRFALEKAFAYMVKRHEVLRTVIHKVENEPVQVVQAPGYFQPVMHFEDLSDSDQPLKTAKAIASREGSRVFDMEEGPLFYFKILQLGKEDHVLVLNFHHIIMDGWSMDIFVRELLDAYTAYCNGMETSHAPLRVQYKEYAAWQNKQLGGALLKEHRKFWMDVFKTGVPRLQLPLDHPRPAERSSEGKWMSFRLEEDASRAIDAWLKEKDITMFMSVRAIVQLLLYFYTGQTDIVTGSPVAGRNHIDLEHVLGFMVNILPVRVGGAAENTFDQLLTDVKKAVLDSFRYQLYPFDQLVEDLAAPVPPGHSPVFDVMVTLQHSNDIPDGQGQELVLTELDAGYAVSKYDISFIFTKDAQGITVSIEYASTLFNESRIHLMQEYLKKIMLTLPEAGHETLLSLKQSIMGKAIREKARKDLFFDLN